MQEQIVKPGRLYRQGVITSGGAVAWGRLSPWVMETCMVMIRGGCSPDEVARLLVQISRDVETRGWGVAEEVAKKLSQQTATDDKMSPATTPPPTEDHTDDTANHSTANPPATTTGPAEDGGTVLP